MSFGASGGGFGFGSSSTTASTGGFGFGSTTSGTGTSTGGFGGFGSTAAKPASTGFGGFGAAPATTGGFGSTPAASTGFGGFGASTGGSTFGSNTATTTTATGFGATSSGFGTASTGFGSSSGFGSTSTGGFGSSSTGGFGSASTGGFGSASTGFGAPSTTGGLFGASTGTGFGQPQQQQQQLDHASHEAFSQFSRIKESYNPESSDDKFKFFFYNLVGDTNVGKPANCNERKYSQAKQNNPDATRFVPVQAAGFADLKNRINEQNKGHDAYTKKIEDTKNILTKMEQDRDAAKLKIGVLRKTQSDLAAKLLNIMSQIELMRTRNQPVRVQEVNYRKRLQTLSRRINHPNQFKSKVNEMSEEAKRMNDRGAENQYLPMDDVPKQRVYQFLQTQKEGLVYLTQVIQKDSRDMDKIAKENWRKILDSPTPGMLTYH